MLVARVFFLLVSTDVFLCFSLFVCDYFVMEEDVLFTDGH